MRSSRITQAARGEPCTLQVIHGSGCSSNETTVFCHAPSPMKGMGIKSPDYWGAFGCGNCHAVIDRMSTKESLFYWYRGICRTQQRLFETGILTEKT